MVEDSACLGEEVFGAAEAPVGFFGEEDEAVELVAEVVAESFFEGVVGLEFAEGEDRGGTLHAAVEDLQQFAADNGFIGHCETSMATSSLVPEYVVIELFADLRIFERIEGGCLRARVVERETRPAKMCRSVSYIVRVETLEGEFAARVHYVWCEDLQQLFTYPSSIRVGDMNIFREGHQEAPPGPSR